MKFYVLLALVVVAFLTFSEARNRRNIGQGAGYNQGIGGGAQPNWNNNGYNNGIGGGAQPNYNNNNNYNAYGSSGHQKGHGQKHGKHHGKRHIHHGQ